MSGVRRSGLGWAGLAALAGVLQALSVAPTPQPGLQILAWALWVWSLQGASPQQAALRGFSFGWAWLSSSLWWIFISLNSYGHLPAVASAAAVGLLTAFLALFPMLAALGYVRSGFSGFAFWALLSELGRATLLGGFPWAAPGYAHVDGPLSILAPWIGVHGLGFLAVAWAAFLVAQRKRWRSAAGVVVIGLTLVVALPPTWTAPITQALSVDFTQPSGTLRVALLQSNVMQDEKFDLDHIDAVLDWHAEQLQNIKADLIVTPETAIPLLQQQLPTGWWERLAASFEPSAAGSRHALIGMPLGNRRQGYSNAVVGLGGGAAAGAYGAYRYDKYHLLPFGEFVPFGFRWFVELLQIPLGDFNRGVLAAPSFTVGQERIGPSICVEDLYGEEMASRFMDAATAPTMLASLSNLAWFGPTVALDQHLHIARMRALEMQRPFLHATNTGASAFIDHRGVVQQQVPRQTRAVLEGWVQGRTGVTPFARWAGRWGLIPLGLLAILGLGFIRLRQRRGAKC
ncbi:MAG: apolipoprotein N-acyltransferase [Leptothrix ochracea]|uniref:apolipoprotein N-acyltransferase n=1 Tax=Leptothrix ochracea TaxID=735331 RepID=UPI0034E1DCAA